MTRPDCECHGVPMRRNTDKRYQGGFYWRCAVKDRAQTAAYFRRRYNTDPLFRTRKNLDSRLSANRLRRERRTPASREIAAFLITVRRRTQVG